MKSRLVVTCTTLGILMIAAVASAEIVATPTSGTYGTLAVSGTDLANSNQPSFVSITPMVGNWGNGGTSYLVDGTVNPNPNADQNQFAAVNGAVVTIQLSAGTGSNSPLGYDISSIVTTTGNWTARQIQSYDLAYETMGGTWVSLPSVVNLGTESNNGSVQVAIYEDNPSVSWIATGVQAIRFTFHNASVPPAAYGEAVYQEIDVFGRATPTPEPGMLVLLATGLAGLLAYAWRRWR